MPALWRMDTHTHTPKITPAPGPRFFPTILIVLLAVFNDGAMIALSKARWGGVVCGEGVGGRGTSSLGYGRSAMVVRSKARRGAPSHFPSQPRSQKPPGTDPRPPAAAQIAQHAANAPEPTCVHQPRPQDRVTPSPAPNCWRLRNIFAVGIVYGLYLTVSTWTLYQARFGFLWGRGAAGLRG